jgi:hypothetical protein
MRTTQTHVEQKPSIVGSRLSLPSIGTMISIPQSRKAYRSFTTHQPTPQSVIHISFLQILFLGWRTTVASNWLWITITNTTILVKEPRSYVMLWVATLLHHQRRTSVQLASTSQTLIVKSSPPRRMTHWRDLLRLLQDLRRKRVIEELQMFLLGRG